MQTIAGAKKLKRMNKDKKMQDIEKAFNLIEAIDFSRFVEIMKGRTLSDLQFWFGDRVKELPNVNQIFEAKEQRRKGGKVLFEHSGNMPDMKFGLINALHKIAERLLFNEEHLNQIRTGNERFLNMPLIGQLWADSETLLKYRNVLLNWDNSNSPQAEREIRTFDPGVFREPQPQKLSPELQKVYDQLPELIDLCQLNEKKGLPKLMNVIELEINLKPEQKEAIILEHRDKAINRYNEIINSGLGLKATDTKEFILWKLGMYFFIHKDWEIPLPNKVSYSSLTPDPVGHIKTAIAPLFKLYYFIQACNDLLSPEGIPTIQEANSPAPETIVQRETTEQKIKRILEPLRGAFDDSSHIDTIIEAFIKQAYGDALPKGEKQILKHMKPNDFLKPFGELFSEGLLLRGIITETLLRYVKKNTYAGDPEYSQAYFNKLLSSYK